MSASAIECGNGRFRHDPPFNSYRKQSAIVADLGISIQTLDTHRRSVKRKLQISPQATTASAALEVLHRVDAVVMRMREAEVVEEKRSQI